MKIAMIGQKGMPAVHGGVERHVHDLAMELVSRRYEVVVYARRWYTNAPNGTYEGVMVKHLPTIRTKHFDAITHTFFSTVHAMFSDVDVMHFHGVGPSLLSWIPRIFAPHIRVVTTFHSIDREHKKWGFFARLMLRLGEWSACRFAHQTIAVSPTIAQYARDCYSTDSVYIPNAVTLPSEVDTSYLDEFGLKPKKYIVMISRLVAHKGAHYLIDAWKELKHFHPEVTDGYKLVIVGDGAHTDEYVTQLKHMAAGEDDVLFTGFQSGETLAALFAHAAAMVHPSDNEGLPIGVLEGMSYGLPMILSSIPEHVLLLPDKKWLFEAGSISALQEKLKTFFSLSPTQRQKIGRKNKTCIEAEYQWKSVMEKIEKVYKHEADVPVYTTAVRV